jgi:SAM-dependent methyltransferase
MVLKQTRSTRGTIDIAVPRYDRFSWPKHVPEMSPQQLAISDDFMKHWHEVLPSRYGAIERFNHTYPMRHLPTKEPIRTLEVGAGIGGHLKFEPLEHQDYHCIELRESMAAEIRRRYPGVTTVTGDCQQKIPYGNAFFDRVVVIHVLEHLPDLPRAMIEISRVLKRGGIFSAVLPCDPGLLYEAARKISAEHVFHKRYGLPYRWYIRREHINSPAEILHVVREQLSVFETSYFPFHIPIASINLCIGLTATKP